MNGIGYSFLGFLFILTLYSKYVAVVLGGICIGLAIDKEWIEPYRKRKVVTK